MHLDPLECEGPVAVNETMIEASLVSMRKHLGEVWNELRELRADNRAMRDKLEQKTDAIHQSHLALSAKIEAVQTILRDKLDERSAASNSKIDDVNAALTSKIDAVNASLMKEASGLLK